MALETYSVFGLILSRALLIIVRRFESCAPSDSRRAPSITSDATSTSSPGSPLSTIFLYSECLSANDFRICSFCSKSKFCILSMNACSMFPFSHVAIFLLLDNNKGEILKRQVKFLEESWLKKKLSKSKAL